MTATLPGESTERHVVGACPLDCPDGCSWVVTVKDDVAVKLRGNPDHPYTAGGLCKKVYPWLEFAADPNRLMTPLRRVAAKGSSSSPDSQSAAFEPISWAEALDEIAKRFQTIIDTDGPAAIWPFSGTGNMGFIQGASTPVGDRLWNHLGVSNHDLTICSPSGHAGLGYSMGVGVGMDPEDVVSAEVVLIWGANTLVSGQHWWPFVEQAQNNGATVIVVDPVRTRTADRADLHVAPRVGTDGALALGVCRSMIDRGLINDDFVKNRTHGFDEFAASLEPWTLEYTADVCGMTVDDITAFVDALTAAAPLAVKFGHGAQRHAGGGQAARTISCIPALLGSFETIGGGLFYSTGPRYALNLAAAAGSGFGARPRTLAMTNLVANLDATEDPVNALFIYGANPAVSNPDTVGVRRALKRDDLFTVVVDLYHTDTTDYADIVLPGSMAHEHLDLNNSFGHMYLNLNQPAVKPPGDCLPQTEIFRRLATAMGLEEPSLFATDEDLLDALLDTPEFRDAGVDADRLHADGFVRLPASAKPFQPFTDQFPTASKRFEFVSERGERDGVGRLPHYVAPVEAGLPEQDGFYDLVAAAGSWHINSTFAGTKVTERRTSAPPIVIHPGDADRDGLSEGDAILVSNERGSFTAQLAIDTTARPGTAVCTKGWWSQRLNNTILEQDNDMGQGAIFHDNRVQISPA